MPGSCRQPFSTGSNPSKGSFVVLTNRCPSLPGKDYFSVRIHTHTAVLLATVQILLAPVGKCCKGLRYSALLTVVTLLLEFLTCECTPLATLFLSLVKVRHFSFPSCCENLRRGCVPRCTAVWAKVAGLEGWYIFTKSCNRHTVIFSPSGSK